MKNFKDGFSDFGKTNNFKARPKFGGSRDSQGGSRYNNSGPRSGGKSSGQTELYSATCSTCHKSCEVPFRPNGEKPVYCSACFGKSRDDNEKQERGGQRNTERNDARSFQKNTPVESVSKADILQIKQQLSKIELQLNRVLEFVNPPIVKEKKIIEPKIEEQKEEVVDVVILKKPRKTKVAKAKVVTKKVAKKKDVKTVSR